MTTTLKIFVTIGILLFGTLIKIAMNGSDGNSRAPMFLVMGVVAGIGAIWKYKPEPKKDTTSDKQELDKTNN